MERKTAHRISDYVVGAGTSRIVYACIITTGAATGIGMIPVGITGMLVANAITAKIAPMARQMVDDMFYEND